MKEIRHTRYGVGLKVQQIDKKSGKVLKIWDCIADAERETGINNAHITEVCKGKRRSAGSFVWRYVQ